MKQYRNELQTALRQADTCILACKASGGYKWRARIRLSDAEIDELMVKAERHIRLQALQLCVAEQMLREPAPSIHARWEEYQQKLMAAVEMIQEEGES